VGDVVIRMGIVEFLGCAVVNIVIGYQLARLTVRRRS